MAKTLFKIDITDEYLGAWLDEMYKDDGEELDDIGFLNDLNKVCEAAEVDCGGRTALTDWMWSRPSYEYIMSEIEGAVKEYMASVLNKEE